MLSYTIILCMLCMLLLALMRICWGANYTVAVQADLGQTLNSTRAALERYTGVQFLHVIYSAPDLITACAAGLCDFAFVDAPTFQCLQLATGAKGMNELVAAVDGTAIDTRAGNILGVGTPLHGQTLGVPGTVTVDGYLAQYKYVAELTADPYAFSHLAKVVISNSTAQLSQYLRSQTVTTMFAPTNVTGPIFKEVQGDYPVPHTTALFANPLLAVVANVSYDLRNAMSIALLAQTAAEPGDSPTFRGWTTPGEYATTRVAMQLAGLFDNKTNLCVPDFHSRTNPVQCPPGDTTLMRACSTCPPSASCYCGPFCHRPRAVSVSERVGIILGTAVGFGTITSIVVMLLLRRRRKRVRVLRHWTEQARKVFGDVVVVSQVVFCGANVQVFRGRWYDRDVAIKVQPHTDSLEVEVASSLVHPNVVGCYADGVDAEGNQWLVVEWCNFGNLTQAIESGYVRRLDRKEILQDVSAGLSHIASHGVIHGDLSSNNVLLSQRSDGKVTCKVCDLGRAFYASSFSGGTTPTTTIMCTPPYAPPEMVREGVYSPSHDVYGFGILLWEVVHCCKAYKDETEGQVWKAKMEGRNPVFIVQNEALHGLFLECCSEVSRDRPTIEHVCMAVKAAELSH